MKSHWAVLSITALLSATALAQPAKPQGVTVDVFKTPTCGCCSKWVDHMRAAGFTVRTTDLNDVSEVKARHGVPPQLESCHTATVGGYVVEGHMPASDVRRLLKERPKVVGIAVPGMPAGSPGMEVPGGRVQPYSVVSFDKAGKIQIFATHGDSQRR
jgi:hypothetical protein